MKNARRHENDPRRSLRDALDHRLPAEVLRVDPPAVDSAPPLTADVVDRLTKQTMEKYAAFSRTRSILPALIAAAAAILVSAYFFHSLGNPVSNGDQNSKGNTDSKEGKDSNPERGNQDPPPQPRWDRKDLSKLEFEFGTRVMHDDTYPVQSRVVAMTRIQIPVCNACVELRRIIKEHPDWASDAQNALDELLNLIDAPNASAGAVPKPDGTYYKLVERLRTADIEDIGPDLIRVARDARAGIQALHKISDVPGRLGSSGRFMLRAMREYVIGKSNARQTLK